MGRFFDKLEKLDVLMIIFVVIVCLFALVVMYGWPKGEWAFGWTALAAIGSLAAGIGAFYAARVALRITQEERVLNEERKRNQAIIYRWVVMIELISVQAVLLELEIFLLKYISCKEGQELVPELEELLDQFKARLAAPITLERLSELHIFGVITGQALAAIVANLPTFQSTLNALIASSALITKEKQSMAKLALNRLEMLKRYYENIEWEQEI